MLDAEQIAARFAAAVVACLFACSSGAGGDDDDGPRSADVDAGDADRGDSRGDAAEVVLSDSEVGAGDGACGDSNSETCTGDLVPDPEERVLAIVVPAKALVQEHVPVVLRVHKGGVPDLNATFDVVVRVQDDQSGTESVVAVRRGAGSGRLALPDAEGAFELLALGGGLSATGKVEVEAAFQEQAMEVEGKLAPEELQWTGDSVIFVVGDLEIQASQTLEIAQGTVVELAEEVSLEVYGNIAAKGTAGSPIWFRPAPGTAWGGIAHHSGSKGLYEHVIFSGGGGDESKAFGHSGSQPVLFAKESDLVLDHCAVIDSPGKAMGAEDSRIDLKETLISRCDTGGELKRTRLTAYRSHFLEMPAASGDPQDDDNDGIYLSGEYVAGPSEEQFSIIDRCVFALGWDDGIDHNGANVIVENTIIEGFFHEGVACSKGGKITVSNSLIRGCEQGIEAGYGGPEVVVDHCVLTENDVGLRYGDSYDWDVNGTLAVTSTVSFQNSEHNVWNYVNNLGGPAEDAVDISCSMVDDPAWDGNDGNVPGVPRLDSAFLLAPGSPGESAACDGKDTGLLEPLWD